MNEMDDALYDQNAANETNLPQADYSNEGRNYPTVESTQGTGGSPIVSSTTTNWSNVLQNLLGGTGSKKSIADLLGGASSNPLQGIMGMVLLSKLLDKGSRTPTVG